MRRWSARVPALLLATATALGGAELVFKGREPENVVFVADLKYARPPTWTAAGWVEGREPTGKTSLRVACVGDSLTEGVGVTPRESWPGQLHQTLKARKVEILNFGVAGWDAAQVAALLETRIARWQPDVVVWGTYANDIFRTVVIRDRLTAAPIFVDPDVPEPFRIAPPWLSRWLVPRSALFRHLQGAYYLSRASTALLGGEEWYAGQVGRIVDWHQKTGVPVVVLAIPSHILAGGCPETGAERCAEVSGWYTTLTRVVSASGLPWVDGLAALVGSGPYFTSNAGDIDHPNAQAHRLLAGAVEPEVERWLPPPPPANRRRPPRRYPDVQ